MSLSESEMRSMIERLSESLDPHHQGLCWPSPVEWDGRESTFQLLDLIRLAAASDDEGAQKLAEECRLKWRQALVDDIQRRIYSIAKTVQFSDWGTRARFVSIVDIADLLDGDTVDCESLLSLRRSLCFLECAKNNTLTPEDSLSWIGVSDGIGFGMIFHRRTKTWSVHT